MIEQTNELVRSFNASVKQDVLVECNALLSSVGRLPGLDGKAKMSKSIDNAIRLSAEPDEIRKAVNRMFVPGAYSATIIASGICWSAAFAIYAVRYWPVLSRARLDGKPG